MAGPLSTTNPDGTRITTGSQILRGSGLGLSVASSIYSGLAEANALNMQASLGDLNQFALENQAIDAETRGEIDAARFAMQAHQAKATGRTAFAGGNVRVDEESGSVADWESDFNEANQATQRQIRANAEKQAKGFRIAAGNARIQSEFARTSARNAKRSAYINAGISILGAAGTSIY